MQLTDIFARSRFVFLDGGMGTQLTARGLQPGQKPELAALTMPETLTAIHRDYARAGAEILCANTFGANPRKLAGAGCTVDRVVAASIACARSAADETGALVALDVGPLGELLAPAGTLAFEDAVDQFAQVVEAGVKAAITAWDWAGLILICFVLPAVICPLLGLLLRKLGWIKEGDLKLD